MNDIFTSGGNYGMELMEVLFVILGAIIGVFVTKLYYGKKVAGNLRIDHSDEEPYLFLEINDSLQTIENKDHVILRVRNENYVSHD